MALTTTISWKSTATSFSLLISDPREIRNFLEQLWDKIKTSKTSCSLSSSPILVIMGRLSTQASTTTTISPKASSPSIFSPWVSRELPLLTKLFKMSTTITTKMLFRSKKIWILTQWHLVATTQLSLKETYFSRSNRILPTTTTNSTGRTTCSTTLTLLNLTMI